MCVCIFACVCDIHVRVWFKRDGARDWKIGGQSSCLFERRRLISPSPGRKDGVTEGEEQEKVKHRGGGTSTAAVPSDGDEIGRQAQCLK